MDSKRVIAIQIAVVSAATNHPGSNNCIIATFSQALAYRQVSHIGDALLETAELPYCNRCVHQIRADDCHWCKSLSPRNLTGDFAGYTQLSDAISRVAL